MSDLDLLLYNARIFSGLSYPDLHQFDQMSSFGQLEHYNIIGISNGQIVLLENTEHLSQQELNKLKNKSKSSLDLNNKCITPGLIDCHTHLVFAGSRANEFAARLEGQSYQEITQQGGGINSTVRATREAGFEELLAVSENRIKQILNQGVTCLEIKSGYGLNLEAEKKILQVADSLSKKYPVTIQKTFLGAHVVPKLSIDNNIKSNSNTPVSNTSLSNGQYIKYLTDKVLPELVSLNLIDAVDGFCEGIAFSAQELLPLYQKAAEYNLPVKGHTEQLSKIGGAELICKFNGLSCDHLEYADENIVKLLASNNTTAVLLPGAYYYLKETQKPPINYLRKYNVPIAIATDFNPGTSPILNISTIMNMACVLYNLTPGEAWAGVTLNAAKALGLENKLGSIEVNKQADLVIWDFEHPYDLCYYMGASWNKTIIKNGKLINIREYDG